MSLCTLYSILYILHSIPWCTMRCDVMMQCDDIMQHVALVYTCRADRLDVTQWHCLLFRSCCQRNLCVGLSCSFVVIDNHVKGWLNWIHCNTSIRLTLLCRMNEWMNVVHLYVWCDRCGQCRVGWSTQLFGARLLPVWKGGTSGAVLQQWEDGW